MEPDKEESTNSDPLSSENNEEVEVVTTPSQYELVSEEDEQPKSPAINNNKTNDVLKKILEKHSLFLRDEKTGRFTQTDSDSQNRESFWCQFFHETFVDNTSSTTEDTKHEEDDCVFFVKKQEDNQKQQTPVNQQQQTNERFFVRRKGGKVSFPEKNDPKVNWEESFFFNSILHHFTYSMEVSIREREIDQSSGKSRLKVLRKVAQKVYATPNKVRVDLEKDDKSDQVELTYPLFYFAVDNFDEAWKDIYLQKDGELVCVELFATGNFFGSSKRIRLFAGALDNETIRSQYRNRKLLFNFANTQFFRLVGPRGRGAAQMAVASQAISKEEYNRLEAEHREQQQRLQQNSNAWKNTFSKFGSTLKSWTLAPLNLADPAVPTNRLNCSLTYLNIRWDLIIRDVLLSTSKSVAK